MIRLMLYVAETYLAVTVLAFLITLATYTVAAARQNQHWWPYKGAAGFLRVVRNTLVLTAGWPVMLGKGIATQVQAWIDANRGGVS